MIDRVGQQFGNYRLVAVLGRGGYAEVYLGQHVRLLLQAAVKVLYTHLTGSEAEWFQREAETIARLAHPSIVRILDYDVQEDVPFLVMDYAPGGSSRRRYPKGSQVPLPLLMAAVKQVAAALQFAHDHKIIHRDVKPENLLLGRYDEVLLSDFGLATLTQSTSSLIRSGQGTAGTIAYMAPEQIEGHPRVASDQYALGVVVYEWLSGQRPFEGSMSEVMIQHLSIPPPPLHERVPTLSAEMEQVVLQALAKDPVERFASVQDFVLALEGACRMGVSTGHTLLALSSASPTDDRHTSTHNLPAPLTSLIGREQDVRAACTLLRSSEVRLVTLTGTGGVGKTRLALQVATEVLADFPDGVFLVSLAPISDPALVIPTIAQVLDVKENGARPLLDLLTAFLKDKCLLLCLDNFEQLLPGAPHLTDLLTRCPRLSILVTSRAVLHIQGEHELSVPPLSVPDLTPLPPADTLPAYTAVALFLQRAQAVQPTFQLTSSNARSIAEICVRLDGLPLAIELAAARSKLLSPQALLARLGQRFAVLTSGPRDAPARQQTLRNTIAWSYHLLDAQEQRLFRWLSAFVGGCTLEAIEAVCDALDKNNAAVSVLDGVASLIDKSLLQQTEQEGNEPRLVLLETIREYGLEALAASGEMEVIRHAHATYYLRLSEEAEPELHGPQQAMWLERLEREHDNLRAAMQWLLDQGKAGYNGEMALRLGTALQNFWFIRGQYREGRNFLEQALTANEGVAASVQAKAFYTVARLATTQGDYHKAETLCEKSLALFRKLEDKPGIARSLYLVGVIAWNKGNLTMARALGEEALMLFREVDDKDGIASALFRIATVISDQGEYEGARALFKESLTMDRELGNTRGTAPSLWSLARLNFVSQGDSEAVCSLLAESLALYRAVGDKGGIADSLYLSGWVVLQQGNAVAARSLADESILLYREIADQPGIAQSLSLLAKVEARQGGRAAARALYEESLALARKEGDKLIIVSDLEGLAGVVAIQDEPTWAARLWGVAEALREVIGAPISPIERTDYERSVAAARAALGDMAFATAWAEGRTMRPEQALSTQSLSTMPITNGPSSTPRAKSATTSPDGLSARELEVLRLLATGLTDAQIAEQLVLSLHTIHAHLRTIYSKLGVTSRSAATRYAFEHQLV